MFGGRLIPSWFDIDSHFERPFRAFNTGMTASRFPEFESTPSFELIHRRIASVREAFRVAEIEVGRRLLQRFSDLDIRVVLNDLIAMVKDLGMILAGSALTGGMVGGGIGFLAGGVGAFPGAMAGAVAGVQAGAWILGVLGLASITEFFTEGLKPILDAYARGISTAWNGPQERSHGPMSYYSDNGLSAGMGGLEIALAHEAVVVLLLSAIVAYLTRGRGNASVLAGEMQRSERGAKLGQWMLKHEDVLKQHPDLQSREPRVGSLASADIKSPQNRPSANDREQSKGRPNTMALHEVECFKADKMPESKIGEFERQLQGQEDGLNRLTVGEYLENIASPVSRNSATAQKARKALKLSMHARFQKQFQKEMSPLDAEMAASRETARIMSNLAGLHNPDLRAGGKDIIADFGDRQVNSSIGPQWVSKITRLKLAAEKIPESVRGVTFINVKLHRC